MRAASAIIQLSINCEEKLLGQVIKLLQDPFVSSRVCSGDTKGLSALLGMNLYTKESFLRDRYGATIDRQSGKLRVLSTSRRLIWEVDEDCLYTAESRFWRDLIEQSADSANYSNAQIGGADSVENIERIFYSVDFKGVEAKLLPYLFEHDSAQHNKVAVALRELPRQNGAILSPKSVPIDQLYLWGRFINVMAQTFSGFRFKNSMVPIPGKFEDHPLKTAKTNVVMGEWDPSFHAVPVMGNKFADWEKGALKGLYPDCLIYAVEDKEYAAKTQYMDAFQLISSKFFEYPKLPDFNLQGTVPEQAPHEPNAVRPTPDTSCIKGEGPNLGDGLDGQRAKLREMAHEAFDLNKLSTKEREELKEGGPAPSGKKFKKGLSKIKLGTFCSKIPPGRTPFREVVKELRRHFPNGDEDGLAWYLTNKLILGKSQFPVEESSTGELMVIKT